MTTAIYKGYTDIDSNAKVGIPTDSMLCPVKMVEVSNQVTREKLDSLHVGQQVEITISSGKAIIH